MVYSLAGLFDYGIVGDLGEKRGDELPLCRYQNEGRYCLWENLLLYYVTVFWCP